MNLEDALLRGLLSGRSAACPVGLDAEDFVHAARLHRVLPILHGLFSAMPGAWPGDVVAASQRACVDNAVSEVVQRAELLRVLDAFATAGLAPLLLKGAALAYTHYPDPAMRYREDSDLFVAERDVAAASALLTGLGYAKHPSAVAATASQSSWTRRDERGYAHHVDLHWRINNSPLLARTLSYEDAARDAVAVTALGPHARTLSPVHSLLLACIHRAGHLQDAHFALDPAHPGGDRLVWFHDMRLLAERFGESDWDAFVRLAQACRVRALCADALRIAARDAGAPVPPAVLQRLSRGPREPSASLLDGRPVSRLLAEVLAVGGLASRLRYLSTIAFPPAAHLRRKYAGASFGWLPWLYARRGAEGVWKIVVPRTRR